MNWIDGLPDWCDTRKPAEIEWPDGRRVTGRIHCEGEGELPECFLVTSAGKMPIGDSKRFRLI